MENYTITKDPKVKEEFEVGKVYKTRYVIIRVTRIENNNLFGYGFYKEKIFEDNDLYWYSKNFKPATEEEFGKLLIKQAERIGYKGEINYKFNNLANRDCVIFNNGKWAEIIETITKADAEKLLNKIII